MLCLGYTWYLLGTMEPKLKIYTLEQVRELIGGDLSITTIERWAREGRLPVIRLSPRVIRVEHEALKKFLAVNSSGGDR